MNKKDPLAKLFLGLRPTKDELAKVKAAEGDPIRFAKVLRDLDRKYKVRSLQTLGVDKKVINEQASYPVTQSSSARLGESGDVVD